MRKPTPYKLAFFVFIVLLILCLKAPSVALSQENAVPGFAPSGYFKTRFLPSGNMSIGSTSLLFLNGSEVVRSEDGGATWRTMPKPITSANILTIMASPNITNDQTVFAGSDHGIHLSFDNGSNWRSPQQPFNKPVSQIVFSPDFATDHTVYAAGPASSAYLKYSMNGGEQWQNKTLPRNSSVQQIIISPADSTNQTLYIRLADSSLWYSPNGGTTWSRADVGLGIANGNYVHRIRVAALSPNNDLLFAATQWGLVLSFDHGQVWYLLSTKTFVELLVPPDVANTLTLFGLEVYNGPFQKTTDLGATWDTQLAGHQVSDIELSPNYETDHAIYARSSDRLWVSFNNGGNWQQKSGSLAETDFATIYQIALSPHYENDGTLFAAALLPGGTDNDNQLLRSVDYGQSWSTHEIEGEGYIQIAVSPNFSNDHTVWATRNTLLYRSTDGGLHWSLITSLPFIPFYSHSRIQLSPNYATDRTIFVSHYLRGLYRSTDNGASWVQLVTNMSNAITDFAISPGYPADPTLYLSVYNDGLYRSTTGGTSWSLLPPPDTPTSFAVVLSPNFVQDNTLFIAENGNSGGGVYRSTNRGNTWTDVTGPHLTYFVHGLAVSPRFSQDQTIIASRESGPIYISEDAGTTWFQLDEITDIGGIDHNWGGLALGYKNGLLQPFAASGSIYFYQWPTGIRPPTSIGIPLEPNSTEPGSIAIPLPQYEREIHWTVTENIPWLTVSPATGTLLNPMMFTVDPTAVSIPAAGTVSIGVYLSTKQAQFYTVPIYAFYANHRSFFPVVQR